MGDFAMQSFKVNRDLPEGRYQLCEVFSGLEEVDPLRSCVGGDGVLSKILQSTSVTLSPENDYMYVNDGDGSLVVGLNYLKTADTRYLYLDIIHELVHIRQYLDGKELFDKSYSYVDRPTEIEAYQCAVQAAREIGMNNATLAEYLYVEWITRKDHARLLKALGVGTRSL